MKRVAMPVADSRISNRIDCSSNFLIASIENGVINKRELVHLVDASLPAKLKMWNQYEVNVLICDGIPQFYLNQLTDSPFQVIPWICGEVEDVLQQYVKGTLTNQDKTSVRE